MATDIQLNLSDVRTTVKATVTIGTLTVKWATGWGNLGSTPNKIDVTPTSSGKRLNVPGVIDDDSWTVDLIFTAEEFKAIKAMVNGKEDLDVSVNLSDGSKFTNKGIVGSVTIQGGSVDSAVTAQVEVYTSGEWDYVDAAA